MPNHDPDPNCRWCKGTGEIQLARSVVDCDCRAPDGAFHELLGQLKALGPPEATSGDETTVFLDFDGTVESNP